LPERQFGALPSLSRGKSSERTGFEATKCQLPPVCVVGEVNTGERRSEGPLLVQNVERCANRVGLIWAYCFRSLRHVPRFSKGRKQRFIDVDQGQLRQHFADPRKKPESPPGRPQKEPAEVLELRNVAAQNVVCQPAVHHKRCIFNAP